MKKCRLVTILIGCLALLTLGPAATTHGDPPVPDPSLLGPFAVGHMSIMLTDPSRPCDRGDRPIPVEIF
ncbi:MAG: hypothetical protein ACOY3Y_19355 [Acidobacteriota bacterium]